MDDGDRIGELEDQLTGAIDAAAESRQAYDRMVAMRDEAANELASVRGELDRAYRRLGEVEEQAARAVGVMRDAQERWEARCVGLESELEVARQAIRAFEAARREPSAQLVDFVPARVTLEGEPPEVDVSRTAFRGLTSVPPPRVHEPEPPGPELEALRRELAAFVAQTGRRPPLAVAGQVADELYLVQGDDVYRVKGEWVPPQRQGEWPPRDAAGDEVPQPEGAVPMPRLRRLPGSAAWGMACACGETFYTVGDYELHWRDEHGEVAR